MEKKKSWRSYKLVSEDGIALGTGTLIRDPDHLSEFRMVRFIFVPTWFLTSEWNISFYFFIDWITDLCEQIHWHLSDIEIEASARSKSHCAQRCWERSIWVWVSRADLWLCQSTAGEWDVILKKSNLLLLTVLNLLSLSLRYFLVKAAKELGESWALNDWITLLSYW